MQGGAHPRSRGENTKSPAWYHWYHGSSPLTRGKRFCALSARGHARLIPAHAGKTRCPRGRSGRVRAHPRSRGENHRSITLPLPRGGSSPLTRGKRRRCRPCDHRRRLIPAHAGKTALAGPLRPWCAAHPRSRGENLCSRSARASARGSSPLTRGKLLLCRGGHGHGRLIPAHAGKTRGCPASSGRPTAHPRSRGENVGESDVAHAELGSSPLTRGKRTTTASRTLARRLIPAHAGKTRRPRGEAQSGSAHPRSRGENIPAKFRPSREQGSSPLTRGKQGRNCDKKSRIGLIPAHAGKTGVAGAAGAGVWAHPRSRGENLCRH